MEHVIVRKLEHLAGSTRSPRLAVAVETRDRPGPAHKAGAFPGDPVWIQLHGGLFVARAVIELCWIGEFGSIGEIRRRTAGTPLHDVAGFWAGRPRFGYAAVATLRNEKWIEPFWAGPRTYGYEWVVLDNDKKRASWLEPKEAPRGGGDLLERFLAWRGPATR